MDDFNPHYDTLLDSALNELPTAPLPPGFTERVMVAVQADSSRTGRSTAVYTGPNIAARFRLGPLDIALALFWSLVLIAIWFTTLWWTGALTIDWLPQAPSGFSLIETLTFTNPELLLAGVILIALEISVLGLVGLNLLGDQSASN